MTKLKCESCCETFKLGSATRKWVDKQKNPVLHCPYCNSTNISWL